MEKTSLGCSYQTLSGEVVWLPVNEDRHVHSCVQLCFVCSCICVFAAGEVVRLVVGPHQERCLCVLVVHVFVYFPLVQWSG